MSTYWGYACVSHDPILTSEHWLNRGEGTLRDVAAKVRSDSWPEVADPDWPEFTELAPVWHGNLDYAWTGIVPWLLEHPNCEVVLHNERGEIEPLTPLVEA